MKPKWYEGVPPAIVVALHESDHPRPDGIRLGRITVDDRDQPLERVDYFFSKENHETDRAGKVS